MSWEQRTREAFRIQRALRTLALMYLFGALLAGCCTSDRCIAVTVSNSMHEAGDAAAVALDLGCTKRYERPLTPAEIDQLDKTCLPAAAAYGAFRRAHAGLVATLVALQAGDVNGAIGAALKAAEEAAVELARRIQEVSK